MAITGNDFSAAFASFRLRQELTWCNGCRAAGEGSARAALFRVCQTPPAGGRAAGDRKVVPPVNGTDAQADDNDLMRFTGFLVETRSNDLMSAMCKKEK